MKKVQPAVRTSSRAHQPVASIRKRSSIGLALASNGVQPEIPVKEETPMIKRPECTTRFQHIETTIGDPNDVMDVTQYEHIIYRAMCQNEIDQPMGAMLTSGISVADRNHMIDEISHIHYRLCLATNGLYIAIRLINRYMSLKTLTKDNMRIYASAAIFIASKIEQDDEIYPCQARDAIRAGNYCFGSSEPFSRSQLYAAESDLLNTTGFPCTEGTALFFLTQQMRISGLTREGILLARFILEVIQTDERFFEMAPSKQAAVAVMATRAMQKETRWNSRLHGYTSYSEEELLEPLKWIHDDLADENRSANAFIRRKYSTEMFYDVASIPVPSSF